MPEKACCFGCCPVRLGTFIVAVIYIIGSIYGIIISAGKLLVYGHGYEYTQQNIDANLWLAILIMGLILVIGELILSWLLFVGAYQRDETKCLPWLWFNSVLTALFIIVCIGGTIYAIINDIFMESMPTTIIGVVVLIFVCLIVMAMLHTVRKFVSDLRKDGRYSARGAQYNF